MPNVDRIISPFIQGGNPDTMAIQITGVVGSNIPYAPGDLGASFDSNGRTYTVAVLDSGAVAANPVGAPLTTQVLFWKDKANAIVTNDHRQCITPASPASAVAGILRNTPGTLGTYGSLICMLTRGASIPVNSSTTAVGSVMADGAASVARSITATGVFRQLGIARTVDTNSQAIVDVDIPTLP